MPAMDLGLAGAGVLVTGASGGIGAATARAFAAEGARVAVHFHRNREAAEALAGELGGVALGAYWDEHESIGTDPQARSPQLLVVDRDPPGEDGRAWAVRQIVDDPEGHHDFAIVATVDLDASDAAGEPVIRTESFAAAGIARDGVSSP